MRRSEFTTRFTVQKVGCGVVGRVGGINLKKRTEEKGGRKKERRKLKSTKAQKEGGEGGGKGHRAASRW